MWGRNLKQAGQPNQNTSTDLHRARLGLGGLRGLHQPRTCPRRRNRNGNRRWRRRATPSRGPTGAEGGSRFSWIPRTGRLMEGREACFAYRIEGGDLPGAGILKPFQSSLSGRIGAGGGGRVLASGLPAGRSFRRPTQCTGEAGTDDGRIFEDDSISHGRLRACGRRAPSRDASHFQFRRGGCRRVGAGSVETRPHLVRCAWQRTPADIRRRGAREQPGREPARGAWGQKGRPGHRDAAPSPRVADSAHRLPQGGSNPDPLHHHAHRARCGVSSPALGRDGRDRHERGDRKVRRLRRIQGADRAGIATGRMGPMAEHRCRERSLRRRRGRCRGPGDHVLHVGARPARPRVCCMVRGRCMRGGCRPGTGSR